MHAYGLHAHPLMSVGAAGRPTRYIERNMLQLIDERPTGLPETEVIHYIAQTLAGLQWCVRVCLMACMIACVLAWLLDCLYAPSGAYVLA